MCAGWRCPSLTPWSVRPCANFRALLQLVILSDMVTSVALSLTGLDTAHKKLWQMYW